MVQATSPVSLGRAFCAMGIFPPWAGLTPSPSPKGTKASHPSQWDWTLNEAGHEGSSETREIQVLIAYRPVRGRGSVLGTAAFLWVDITVGSPPKDG